MPGVLLGFGSWGGEAWPRTGKGKDGSSACASVSPRPNLRLRRAVQDRRPLARPVCRCSGAGAWRRRQTGCRRLPAHRPRLRWPNPSNHPRRPRLPKPLCRWPLRQALPLCRLRPHAGPFRLSCLSRHRGLARRSAPRRRRPRASRRQPHPQPCLCRRRPPGSSSPRRSRPSRALHRALRRPAGAGPPVPPAPPPRSRRPTDPPGAAPCPTARPTSASALRRASPGCDTGPFRAPGGPGRRW